MRQLIIILLSAMLFLGLIACDPINNDPFESPVEEQTEIRLPEIVCKNGYCWAK